MKAWLTEELGSPPSEIPLTELSITAIAAVLMQHRQLVFNRDFAGLSRHAHSAGYGELTQMLEAVRTRRELHDKFWRYLELFVETMSAN